MKKNSFILVGTIIIGFLLIDRLSWYYSDLWQPNLASTRESIYDVQTRKIDELTGPVDIIFLGDSTVRRAIDDALCSTITQKKCLNLGLTGDMGTFGNYRVLQYYLNRFEAPELILTWQTIDVWERNVKPYLFSYMEPSSLDLIEYIKFHRLKKVFSRKTLKYPVKLLTFLVKHFLINEIAVYRYKLGFLDSFKRWMQAHKAFKKQPARKLRYDEVAFFAKKAFNISYENEFWFDKTIELVKGNKTKIYTGRGPVNKIFQDNNDLNQYLVRMNKRLDEFYSLRPSLFYFNRENFFFSDEENDGDKDHVNDLGKERLTREISNKLKVLLN